MPIHEFNDIILYILHPKREIAYFMNWSNLSFFKL